MSSIAEETLSRAASKIQTGWRNRTTRKRSLEPVLEPIQQPNLPMDRQPSITITNQKKLSNCWNHTVSRLLCRFIFNILAIPYEDTLECDRLYSLQSYSHDYDPYILFLSEASALCQGTGYTKFVLYTFFMSFFNYKFGCRNRQVMSTVLEHASTLFDTRGTFNTIVRNFLQVDRDLKKAFDETLHPLFLEFFEKKETAGWEINYRECKFDTRGPNTLQDVLDKGLYISILMFLGDGPFKFSFDNYRKGRELYNFGSTHSGSISKTNGHIMTIVGYTNITTARGTKQILLHIKNSWGRKWGLDGMFYYYLHDLAEFSPIFNWIEPSDPTVLTFKTTPVTMTEEDFIENNVSRYRRKNEELLTAIMNNEYDKFIPLIDEGADVNIGLSPIDIAIRTNNAELIKQLLIRDAEPREDAAAYTLPPPGGKRRRYRSTRKQKKRVTRRRKKYSA